MYGIGILKGLSVTFKHLITTFVDDIHWVGQRNSTETFQIKQGLTGRGMYTVQYPEEKIAVPERFRFVPFLVTYNNDDPEYPGEDWCTTCGICAKVCPPQCIWIEQKVDPVTGRTKPELENFHIDIDICMNCGYCAEYCPFDAIKMDHDYELATYDRTGVHVRDHAHLVRELRYWEQIAPTTAAEERADRGGYDHKDIQKTRKKANLPASRPGPTSDKPQVVAAPVAVAPAPATAAAVAAPVAAAPTAPAPAAAPATVTNAEGKPVVVRRRNAGAAPGAAAAPAGGTPAPAPAASAPAAAPATPVAPPPVAQAAPATPAAESSAPAPAAPPAPAGDAPAKPVVVRRRNAPPPPKA